MNNISKNIVDEAYSKIQDEKLINDIPHMEQVVFFPDLPNMEILDEVASDFTQNLPNMEILDEVASDFTQKIISELNYLRERATIVYYRPLNSYRKALSPIVIFIKRFIRKLNKFYIEPITHDQSDFNIHLVNTLELFEKILIQKEKEIQELQKATNKTTN